MRWFETVEDEENASNRTFEVLKFVYGHDSPKDAEIFQSHL